MNLVDNGSLTTCPTHPSQIFTGFCSQCLAEKLSIVNGLERSSSRSFQVSDSGRKKPQGEVQVRNTLLSLFQLEDAGKLDAIASVEVEEKEEEENDEIKPFQCRGAIFDGGSWVSCSTTVENSSVDTCAVKQKGLRSSTSSSSSSSWLGALKKNSKNSLHTSGLCCGFEERESKMESDYRHSCDCNFPEDPATKTSCYWEDPRHSLDGSLTRSKAFKCSFGCLDEPNPVPVPVPESNGMCRRRTSRRWSKVWNWNVNSSPFRAAEPRVLERSFSESWHQGGKTVVASGRGDRNNKNHQLSRSKSVHCSSPSRRETGLLRFYLTPLRTTSTRKNSNRPRIPRRN